jgi:predicted outer membrane lipoprotein
LARLKQIAGVDASAMNESGTLLRLSLQPDADAAKVAQEARRTLSEHGDERVPVYLDGKTAATALQRQDWKEASDTQSESTTTETAKPEGGSSWLLAILLACAALAVLLLWWRHHSRRAERQTGNEKGPKAEGLRFGRGWARL